MTSKQVALVTGSGRQRVGAWVAEALAKRGYRVAIHFRTSESQALESVRRFTDLGCEAIALQADLTDERSVKHLFDALIAQWGRLDVLVTCASVWRPKRLEDITAQDVRANFEANALSTFLCCQQAGLVMCRQTEGGCIVTIGDWAIQRPYLDYAAYFLSKGGIPTLTRCLAVEFGTRNPRVRVNCIQPGPVMLPEDLTVEEREFVVNSTLVRREGNPNHVAQAVMYLVDNDFVTGDCVTVDGGRTVFASDVR